MKNAEIKLKLSSASADYEYKDPGINSELFICSQWVFSFFDVLDKKITVCFSDTPHIDSYFLRLKEMPNYNDAISDNNVTVYEGDSTRSRVLYGPNYYVYDGFRDFVLKHFPSGECFISIYVEAS
jgi:hypothetical protein